MTSRHTSTPADGPSTHRTPRRTWPSAIAAIAFASAFGLLIGVGAVAAVIFPALAQLEPVSPAYDAYDGEHWPLLAGHVMQRVFAIAGVGTLILSALGLAGASVAASATPRGLNRRTVALAVALLAVGAVLAHGLALRPVLEGHLTDARTAAAAGNDEAADAARRSFAQLHPTASASLAAQATLLLASAALVLPGGRAP